MASPELLLGRDIPDLLSPVEQAVQRGSARVLAVLLPAVQRLEAGPSIIESAVLAAASNGRLECLRVLLDHGALLPPNILLHTVKKVGSCCRCCRMHAHAAGLARLGALTAACAAAAAAPLSGHA